MTTFTMRRAAAAFAVALGLVSATLASPASADVDEDAIAPQLCGGTTYNYDLETDASGDEAELFIHTFVMYGSGSAPDRLCTFGIVFTDEGSTLDGSYTLSVGGRSVSGAVSGLETVTAPIVTNVGEASSATISARGRQNTYELTEVKKVIKDPKTKAQKAKAKKKYVKAVKKAKKQYAKAGKTKKAKKVYKSRLAKAKKIYKAAISNTRIKTTKKMANVLAPYTLGVTLPLPASVTRP